MKTDMASSWKNIPSDLTNLIAMFHEPIEVPNLRVTFMHFVTAQFGRIEISPVIEQWVSVTLAIIYTIGALFFTCFLGKIFDRIYGEAYMKMLYGSVEYIFEEFFKLEV